MSTEKHLSMRFDEFLCGEITKHFTVDDCVYFKNALRHIRGKTHTQQMRASDFYKSLDEQETMESEAESVRRWNMEMVNGGVVYDDGYCAEEDEEERGCYCYTPSCGEDDYSDEKCNPLRPGYGWGADEDEDEKLFACMDEEHVTELTVPDESFNITEALCGYDD